MFLFVTGNDTDIGKTLTTALIVKSLSDKYNRIAVVKPVESGVKNASNSDLYFIQKINKNNIDNLVFYNFETFKEPLAPLTSSILEDRKVNSMILTNNILKLEKDFDLVIIEGAGGLRVPITKNFEVIDLIKAINATVILVISPFLGTINHTLLSIEAMKSRKISFKGVVINFYPKNPNISELHNPVLLDQYKIKILGVIPKLTKLSMKSPKLPIKTFFSSFLGGKFNSMNFIKDCKKEFAKLVNK
ncbi:dethiobiotin synthase [bacterium]|jgi:dethiobiotin synthetase|nr:dethiobiotin synthase [bacterium]MBT3849992.1 dethiobiotin synthase [bacterium]MBT4435452.1 dethiobiotin synthase [bacterium]|tara:strand:+ start:4162 stop:4899 length:738 start_codon:yes stop_codon:yes gene_type:complete